MTPGDYKREGADLVVRYGWAATPFGRALVLLTERGLAGLTFSSGDDDRLMDEARARWPLSTFAPDPDSARDAAATVFQGTGPDRPLHLKGTNFQIQVWKALLTLPPNAATTYGAVAAATGTPRASRAVGSAAAANPIAFVIPCHRVLRATGLFGGYRWGAVRQAAITGWEASSTLKHN